MATCKRCGSLQLTPRRGTWLTRWVLRLATRSPVFCTRCGWRGHVQESGERLRSRSRRRSGLPAPEIHTAAPEPDLQALDESVERWRRSQDVRRRRESGEPPFELDVR